MRKVKVVEAWVVYRSNLAGPHGGNAVWWGGGGGTEGEAGPRPPPPHPVGDRQRGGGGEGGRGAGGGHRPWEGPPKAPLVTAGPASRRYDFSRYPPQD